MYKILVIFLLMATLQACKSQKVVDVTNENATPEVITPIEDTKMVISNPTANALPAAIVYKTRANYNNKVPVMLNADKTAIMSYPAPSDVRHLPTPLPLADGYLLDQRGIGNTVAFLSLTYKDYAELPAVPSTDLLMKSIIDKNPLLEMYRLPINFNEAVADTAKVNEIIRSHFSGCTPLVVSLPK